tara:strand:+ start:355 stop:597 length:243 start_codon:yes stop_codon:yes gene_type:complete
MSIFNDPDFDTILAGIIYDSRVQSPDCDVVANDNDVDVSDDWDDNLFGLDDDGQPTHYEEMQDVYGGDDYVEQWEDESWD